MSETNNTSGPGTSSTGPTDRHEDEPLPHLDDLDRILALDGVNIEGGNNDDIDDQFGLVEGEDEDSAASEFGSGDDDEGSVEDGQDDFGGEDSHADVALYHVGSIVLAPFDAEESRDRELSDADKAERKWRLSPDDSFSDWSIEVLVSVDGGQSIGAGAGAGAEDKTSHVHAVYHVHRDRLSSGTRFCEYFRAVHSNVFREYADHISRVELPRDAADAFPAFLDYLYLPLSEAKKVITPGNALPLRFLADYFLCKGLSNATTEFIIKRLEVYVSELTVTSTDDEDFQEFLGHALAIFKKYVMHFDAGSPFLLRLAPQFFLFFIESLELKRASDTVKDHTCKLVVEYLSRHKTSIDPQHFLALAYKVLHHLPADDSMAGEMSFCFLKAVDRPGWNEEDDSWAARSFRLSRHKTSIDPQHFLALAYKVLHHLPADDSMAGEMSFCFLKAVDRPGWNEEDDSWAARSFRMVQDHYRKHLSAYLIFGDHSRRDAQRIFSDLSLNVRTGVMEDLIVGSTLRGRKSGIFSVAIKEFITSRSSGKVFTLEFTSPRPIWYVKLKLGLRLADEVGMFLDTQLRVGTLLDEGQSPELEDDYVVSRDDTNPFVIDFATRRVPRGCVIDGVLTQA